MLAATARYLLVVSVWLDRFTVALLNILILGLAMRASLVVGVAVVNAVVSVVVASTLLLDVGQGEGWQRERR